MGLYSGSDKAPIGRIADLIVGVASSVNLYSILAELAGVNVGDVKYTANLNQPAQNDINSVSDLPAGFSGWLYANGKYISGKVFPEMYEFLNGISYEGKTADIANTRITLPILNKFLLMSDPESAPLQTFEQQYSPPAHKHDLGNFSVSENKQIVQKAVYIWTTQSTPTVSNGSMPAVPAGTKLYKDVTLDFDIPESPTVHKGNPLYDSYYVYPRYTAWDVPIDTSFNVGRSKFKCRTGIAGDQSNTCQPNHVLAPMMIYVGKPE